MTHDNLHSVLSYLTDVILLAFIWFWQHLFNAVDMQIDLNVLGEISEVADRAMQTLITILVLVTAYLRYKNERRKNRKDKEE